MNYDHRNPFSPKANPYRDIFFIPNSRHDRPFRVVTDGSCFQTLQEACDHRDHYEANREAIEAAREARRAAKIQERIEHDARHEERKLIDAALMHGYSLDEVRYK